MEPISFGLWLWNVAARAVRETIGFFGWNAQTLLVPILLGVGALVHWKLRGGESLREQLFSIFTFSLVPVVLLALLILGVNLARAPYLLHQEAEARAQIATTDLEAVEADNASLAQRLDEATARLEETPDAAALATENERLRAELDTRASRQ